MLVLTKKDIAFYIIICLAVVVIIVTPISLNSEVITVTAPLENITIVVDAGHGEPDGGAISEEGIRESDLNLQIARKLKMKLEDYGYNIIMTRDDENNIADKSENTSNSFKTSDLNNRVKIANESNAIMLVSIHMNKFSDERVYGAQTFYSKASEKGKLLARLILAEIKNETMIENKREALKIEGIKIIDKSKIPAVIVECGFISNKEECRLLQDEDYQDKIAEGILNGINKYIEINKQ